MQYRPTWCLGRLFYETVSYQPPALWLLIESFGVGQVVLGTDPLHVIGAPVRVIAGMDRAGFEPQDRERVCWANVRDGLGIALSPPGRW